MRREWEKSLFQGSALVEGSTLQYNTLHRCEAADMKYALIAEEVPPLRLLQ